MQRLLRNTAGSGVIRKPRRIFKFPSTSTQDFVAVSTILVVCWNNQPLSLKPSPRLAQRQTNLGLTLSGVSLVFRKGPNFCRHLLRMEHVLCPPPNEEQQLSPQLLWFQGKQGFNVGDGS